MRGLLRRALGLLWGAGGGAALFLALCGAGVVDPADLAPPPAAEETAAAWAPVSSKPFRAATLDPAELDGASRLCRDWDGLVLPMKTPDGALAWVSALPLAADCGASFDLPARNEALSALNQKAGVYTVAEVSCLRDDRLVRRRPDLALSGPGGSPWRDGNGGWWLDPANPAVAAYLTGLCRELADLGFDEILLTDFRSPPGLPGAGAEDLESLCRRLWDALADRSVVLSVRAETAGPSLDADSGQTEALLAAFGRVWTEGGTGQDLAPLNPVQLP